MSKLKISKSDILSMHYFGKTNSEIAKVAGVSRGRICQIIHGYYKCDKDITMTTRKTKKRSDKENKAKPKGEKNVTIMTPILVEMHRQGKSIADIARDTGYDYDEVRKRINAAESEAAKAMAERDRLLDMEQELIRCDKRIAQIGRELHKGVEGGYVSEKEIKDMFARLAYVYML